LSIELRAGERPAFQWHDASMATQDVANVQGRGHYRFEAIDLCQDRIGQFVDHIAERASTAPRIAPVYALVFRPAVGSAPVATPPGHPWAADQWVHWREYLRWSATLLVAHETPTERTVLMATIHFHETTRATPEQFIAGLTDFGPGRAELFKNSADSYLQVHNQGPHRADVTEGSGGVWERLYYDWSDPHYVTLKTIDSNLFGGRSGHTYTLTPQPDGTTQIDVVLVREGKNLRGLVVAGVLGTIGKRSLAKAFAKSVIAIETRSALYA
jgi:hypothetical protein